MSKNYYELTYIITPVLEEDEVKKTIEKVNSFLKEQQAEIEEVNEWGLKRFAYEMEDKSSGYYVNLYFEADGQIIEKLERFFKLEDNVLRFLVLRYDNKMLKHRELQKKGKLPNIFEQEVDEDAIPQEPVTDEPDEKDHPEEE